MALSLYENQYLHQNGHDGILFFLTKTDIQKKEREEKRKYKEMEYANIKIE